ncbi:MAG: GNAT family N-acetyltransferase [Clostridia bacterium]|nr:GNAT family N-acetyltransferase [Clostridia bacterium]
MLEIYNIKDKPQYIEEVAMLTQKEWGIKNVSEEEFKNRVSRSIERINNNLNNPYYCKLILLDGDTLVGFISIFEHDGDERLDLKPWYATMFVKKEYRGNGYSKILNDAILAEAKGRGFSKLYLKSDLVNYYEKFGAQYIEDLSNGEKLYFIEV